MFNAIKTTDFEAIRLKLASPERIKELSCGEVTRPETINYRTQKPEKDGLFCEKIFGPSKDWECYCGKYKKIRYKGITCDKCGVEVTRSVVRRERMGHISLKTPVTHIWFLRGLSSKIGLALDISMQNLEKVVYFASFVITEVNEDLRQATLEQVKEEFKAKKKSLESALGKEVDGARAKKDELSAAGKSAFEINDLLDREVEGFNNIYAEKISDLEDNFNQVQKELKDLKPLTIVSESDYQNLSLKYGHIFTASIGAEAVHQLLSKINLDETVERLTVELEDAPDSKRDKLVKRLKFFKSLRANGSRPEWMVLTEVPVTPPDLRPMVPLDGGRYATSDLNDLYRRIINRNNRLKQLMDLNAPEVICRNEKRMLQEAADALIDNSIRHGKTVVASTGQKRMLKSLADSLKGKQGRFRQNLLGKRTDYSGRSVITVNPALRLYQCGLPKRMAIELFKPFIISKLIARELVHNVRSASRFIEAGHDEVFEILEGIVKEAFVMLNRAPTLHRLGIQAFRPTLVEGLSIQIHPLVCTAFNADFDGDQMAVHVPLTEEAVAEARDIMLASHNLLKPATGDPVVTPSQDIVWGVFYITSEITQVDEKLKCFSSPDEAKMAYELGHIKLRQRVKVRLPDYGLLDTTVGKVMFNEILPEKLRFVNETIAKGKLKNLVKDCLTHYGEDRTVDFLDELKNRSFTFITKSGLSWGMGDLPDLAEVDQLIQDSADKTEIIKDNYAEGLLTDNERYSKIVELWNKTKVEVTKICTNQIDKEGPVFSMIESGARGSWEQLTQVIGMKGMVNSPSGRVIELPVQGNFKKGFRVLEYFIATHGVRKGLSDTALRTANAGYLTRRLVDVAQDIIIQDEDCGSDRGIVFLKSESEELGRNLSKRIVGRFLLADLKNVAGKTLAKNGDLITEELSNILAGEDVPEATVRSVMTCRARRGVCQKCYGYDLAYNHLVALGTAVGIIAAQSIGEPGTQLTMRTFHTGGVAGGDDITQGLPRVEEIFESRPPKRKALMSDVSGVVKIEMQSRATADDHGKIMLSSSSMDKVIRVAYEGEEIDKYSLSDLSLTDNQGKKIKKGGKPEILVADGVKIKKGQAIIRFGESEVVANRAGIAQVDVKTVKIAAEVDKIKEFIIPKGTSILVKDGEQVAVGTQLTEGSLDLQELYILRGLEETQKYIIREIQYIYSFQGNPLNDKHIEVIVRQMFSRVYMTDPGDTNLLAGEVVERRIFEQANADAGEIKNAKLATGNRLLMGMTKAALTTNSFLSSASFQETARVLIDAAITGKIDRLEGLKENVIIGRPIPAGTGFVRGKLDKGN